MFKKIINFAKHNNVNGSVIKATYSEDNEIMTLYYSDNYIEEYKGSCTVWSKLPFMQRPGTLNESFLCSVWKYIKEYGNPYPTAHKRKDYNV